MVCKKCNKNNTSIISEQKMSGKDFRVLNSCLGYICTGGTIGLLCGFCGANKKMESTTYAVCNECGAKWKI